MNKQGRETQWVIDAGMSDDELMCFCPYDDGDVFIGMNFLSTELPSGKLVGIIHHDGEAAAKAWYEANKARVDACCEEGL